MRGHRPDCVGICQSIKEIAYRSVMKFLFLFEGGGGGGKSWGGVDSTHTNASPIPGSKDPYPYADFRNIITIASAICSADSSTVR